MTISDYLEKIDCGAETDLSGGGAVTLKKGEGRTIKAGGSWIYDNEIAGVSGGPADGDIVSVLDHDGYFMGYGFINSASSIRVRMLSRRREHRITPAFLAGRVRAAWDYRKHVVDTSSCRVIFGEADWLPGLTVDKYEDVLVVESLALGIDRLKDIILGALVRILAEDGIRIRGIYERSEAPVRRKEGMEPFSGPLTDDPFDTLVPITENGIRYIVDIARGQKTGFFLDQKENRQAIRRFCRGAEVLDCFTHTGSFALNALAAGASHVTAVDASDTAVRQAAENAALNGFDGSRIDLVCADVFAFLPEEAEKGHLYDVVILDPPAFTKARGTVQSASRGYREINRRGMALVRDGGYLATCTCSHFMEAEHFRRVVDIAAHDAHRRLRQIELRAQAPDHPVIWGGGSSDYLKFYIFQVLEEK